MEKLSLNQIVAIHDSVIKPNELQGLSPDKHLDAALHRIDHKIYYGLINDFYDLAACYAESIAVAHVFMDANKRTAFESMDMILAINGIVKEYDTKEAGSKIIDLVNGVIAVVQLSDWLRNKQ